MRLLFVDVDGVVWKSVDEICREIGGIKGEEVRQWNFNGIMEDEEIEKLFSGKEFFENVEFQDGAKEFLNRYRNDIIMVTHCTMENLVGKRERMNKEGFKDIPIIGVPLGVSKGIINMKNGIFIDDTTHNLFDSNAKIKIQFDEWNDGKKEEREWMKNWNGKVIHNWEEIYEQI